MNFDSSGSALPRFRKQAGNPGHQSINPSIHQSALPAPFPGYRPRRLRQSAMLRQLVRETQLDAGRLVLPLFARSGRKLRRPIGAMPGVFQLSPDEVVREAAKTFEAGVPAVL